MNRDIQYNTGVYILTGTLEGKPLIKVGMTSAGLADRIHQLRESCYAGIRDWKLYSWIALDNERLTSAVERMAHDELADYRVPLVSMDGTKAREVFDITPEAATHAINASLENMDGSVRIDKGFIKDGRITPAQTILQRLIGLVLFLIAVMTLTFSTLAAANPTTQAQDSLLNLKEIDAYHTEPYPKGYANWGERKPDNSHCKKLGEHASTVMKHRQGGTPMSRLMDAVGTNNVGQTLIIAAYEHPRYSVKANQRKAMTDFANDMMVACYKGEIML